MNNKSEKFTLGKLLAVPLLAVMLNACSGDKTDAEYLESAKKYASEGDYKSHVIELKNAIQQNPQNPEARYLLALAYLSEQQGAAAQKELEKAIEFGQNADQLIDELTLAYYYQYNFEDLLSETINHQSLPQDKQAMVLFYRGLANIALKRSSDAEADLAESAKFINTPFGNLSASYIAIINNDLVKANRKVTELLNDDPKFTEAHLLASKIETSNKNLDAAIKHVNSAIENEPNRLQLYIDIARLQLAASQYKEAEKNVDIVLKVAKNHLPSNLLKATLRMHDKDWEAAKEYADIALTVSEVNNRAKLISGVSSFYMKNWEAARDRLKSVVSNLPPQHVAIKMLAYAEFQLGYNQDAEEILSSMGELSKKDNQLLSGFSAVLAKKGEYREALALLEKASVLNPENTDTLTRLGILKLQQQDLSGIKDLESVLESDNTAIWARVALANQYVSQGEIEKALEIANDLIKSSPEKTEGYLISAEVYAANKQYGKAEDQLNTALQSHPDNEPVLISLFNIAAAQSLWDKARSINDKLLTINPENSRALINLYRLDKQNGTTENALNIVEKQVKKPEGKEQTKLLYALLLTDAGKSEDAIIQLAAIKKDSQFYGRAQKGLMGIYGRKKDLKNALIHAENWLTESQGNEKAYLSVVELQTNLGDKKEALKTTQKGVERLPSSKPLALKEIALLFSTEREQQALAKVAKFTSKWGANAELSLIRGAYRANKKEYKEALTHLKNYFEMTPNARGAIGIAEIYNNMGKKELAIDTLKSWLVDHPNDQPVRMFLANLNLNEDKSSAVEQYRELVKQNNNNVVALNNLAWALGETGNLSEAVSFAEKAYNLKPDVPAIMDTYGYLLLLSGDIEEANNKLSEAFEKAPNEPSITYHYALALKESGETSKAKVLLEKIADKEFPEKEKANSLLKNL